MADSLSIGLIQMRCEKADLPGNLAQTKAALVRAALRAVQIVAFPEMSLTGYINPSRYPQAVLRVNGPEVARLLQATRDIPSIALVGMVEENPTGKPYITQLVVREGHLLGLYRKRTIEDEEIEAFSPGSQSSVFAFGDLTFAIAICADVGNRAVYADAARQGARTVFELAAPGLYGEQATRNWESGYRWWEGVCRNQLSGYSRELGLWVAVATQAGRTIDEDFPGGGYVFAPGGSRIFATEDSRPCEVFLHLDLAGITASKVEILHGDAAAQQEPPEHCGSRAAGQVADP